MATYYKRKRAGGIRWTARIRLAGRQATKTFATKGAAETWVRAQERAIEAGEFQRPVSDGVIFADLVDALTEHRKTIRRPLGKQEAVRAPTSGSERGRISGLGHRRDNLSLRRAVGAIG